MDRELIKGDGFTAMQIPADNEMELHGCKSGMIDPSGIARHYAGIEKFETGAIMAYCFRRFGYPIRGWYDYNVLCEWVIDTPMTGVFITIEPTGTSPFGFRLEKSIHSAFDNEQSDPFRKWGKDCAAWAKEKYNIILVDPVGHFAGQCSESDLYLAFGRWAGKKYPDKNWPEEVPEEISDEFFKESSEQCQKIAGDYKIDHPSPLRPGLIVHSLTDPEDVPNTPYWENLPKESVERTVQEAICRTLIDLKRPTYVRDRYMDIEGRVKDENIGEFSVAFSDTAGYGVVVLREEENIKVTVQIDEKDDG